MSAQSIDPLEIRTFQLGGLRLEPASDRLFAIGEAIHVFTQSYESPPGYQVTFELVDGERVFDSAETVLFESSGGGVTAELTTLGMQGGNYQVRARLLTPGGELSAERSVPIVLSQLEERKRDSRPPPEP